MDDYSVVVYDDHGNSTEIVEMILPIWNLDTDTFTYRIRVGAKCALTDEMGYTHYLSTRAFCSLFGMEYNPVTNLETLVESEQAIWVDLTEEEKMEYNNERPWWKKLLKIGELK